MSPTLRGKRQLQKRSKETENLKLISNFTLGDWKKAQSAAHNKQTAKNWLQDRSTKWLTDWLTAGQLDDASSAASNVKTNVTTSEPYECEWERASMRDALAARFYVESRRPPACSCDLVVVVGSICSQQIKHRWLYALLVSPSLCVLTSIGCVRACVCVCTCCLRLTGGLCVCECVTG